MAIRYQVNQPMIEFPQNSAESVVGWVEAQPCRDGVSTAVDVVVADIDRTADGCRYGLRAQVWEHEDDGDLTNRRISPHEVLEGLCHVVGLNAVVSPHEKISPSSLGSDFIDMRISPLGRHGSEQARCMVYGAGLGNYTAQDLVVRNHYFGPQHITKALRTTFERIGLGGASAAYYQINALRQTVTPDESESSLLVPDGTMADTTERQLELTHAISDCYSEICEINNDLRERLMGPIDSRGEEAAEIYRQARREAATQEKLARKLARKLALPMLAYWGPNPDSSYSSKLLSDDPGAFDGDVQLLQDGGLEAVLRNLGRETGLITSGTNGKIGERADVTLKAIEFFATLLGEEQAAAERHQATAFAKRPL